jgi:hypothetical protein
MSGSSSKWNENERTAAFRKFHNDRTAEHVAIELELEPYSDDELAGE